MSDNSTVRPLIVTKYLPPFRGGIETHVESLIRLYAKKKIDYRLIGTDKNQLKINKFNKFLTFGNFSSAPITPLAYFEIKKIITSGANLVHFHSPNPFPEINSLFLNKIPIVTTWHSDIVKQKISGYFYKPFQKKFIEKCDGIIIPTIAHLKSSKQLNSVNNIEKKIHVIPFGIDYEFFSKPDAMSSEMKKIKSKYKNKKICLSVGRHVYYKNFSFLIKAMKKTNNDTHLIIIGNGPEFERNEKIINENKLSEKITLIKSVSQKYLKFYYYLADFFILPSSDTSEAFGLVTAEAMACGKPTIVSNLNNGVNALNIDSKTSLTFNINNEKQLLDHIKTFTNQESLAKTMGDNARKHIKDNYSMKEMSKKTLEVYKGLIV